jgi:integrase
MRCCTSKPVEVQSFYTSNALQNMRRTLSQQTILSLKPRDKPYDVWDKNLSGFIVRVQPSGRKTYYCQFARGKRARLGRADVLTPTEARNKAITILNQVATGENPSKRNGIPTLKSFIEKEYEPWVKANRRTGLETVVRIRAHFADLNEQQLTAINSKTIEQWRTERLNAGIKPSTINRDIACLKTVLAKALEWDAIAIHPLQKLKPLKVDTKSTVRFLSTDEEDRLRATLDEREARIRTDRRNANEWRRRRGYELYASLDDLAFVDHLKPLVLLALNTGLRRGELFNLRWQHVDLANKNLTVLGTSAKSGKTRHIPLNTEAHAILDAWQKQSISSELVFPSATGSRFDNISSSWEGVLKAAGITKFRFHDLRHTFASKLVMAGVNLYVVKELLGHHSIEMTERYAHLAPEHKAEAVARLVKC